MTSTILTANSNFGAVLKNTARRNIGSVIFILVFNTLMAVFGVSITVNTYSDRLKDFATSKYFETVDLSMQTMLVLGLACIFCGLFSIITAPQLFKEIYSKRACDFYFSVPVKRGTYFTASYLFGAVLNVVSTIIPVAIYVLVLKAVNSQVFLFDSKLVVTASIAVIMALLAIYSAFIMCAVTAGRKFQYVLLSLICLYCPVVAITGIETRLNSIWGYYCDNLALGFVSPIINAVNSVFAYDTKYYNALFVFSIVEIIGMFAAGYLVFKNRKAEVAEVSLTGKVVPYFLLGLFVLSGFMFTDTVSSDIVTVFVGIVFAVISGLLFSRIFYKKWFTKITAITTAAVCAVCIIFVCSIYFPSYDKYVKYIPDQEDIEKVEISDYYGSNEYDSVVSQLLSDSYFYDGLYDSDSTVTITESQGIEDALELHRKSISDSAINDRKDFSANFTDLLYGGEYYDSFDYSINYVMKDGSEVRRTYSVGTKFVTNELVELFRNKEVFLQSIVSADDDNILFMASEKYEYYDETEEYDDSYEYVDDADMNSDEPYYYGYGVYEKIYSVQDTEKFTEIYADESVNLDDNNLKIVLNSLYSSFVSSVNFGDGYEDAVYGVDIYYIDPSATEEQKAKLKSMSPEEILKLYSAEYYYDQNSDENSKLAMLVNSDRIELYGFQEKSINFVTK